MKKRQVLFLAFLFHSFTLFLVGALPAQSTNYQPESVQDVIYFDIAVDDIHQRIYGTDRDGNKIDVIDMNTFVVSDTIPVGSQPTGIDINLDDNELAVALYGQGQIAFVSLDTLMPTAYLTPTGTSGPNQPYDLLYGRPGRLYSVGNPGSYGLDYVHVFDTVNKVEVGRSSEVMRAAPRLAMTADHNTLYVSQVSFSPQKIYRFDITTDIPSQTAAAPHGPVQVNTLAVNPEGSRVYSSRGQVWNGDLDTLLGTFSPSNEEIEYVDSRERFFVSSGSQVVEFDAHTYLPMCYHTLAGTAGVARVNDTATVLYVSTQLGIEAVTLTIPVEDVVIEGPASLVVGETATYTASYSPPTATLPVALTWDNGTVGSTAAYSWTLPGTYTITVTATNPCGEASAVFTVTVCQPVESVAISGPDTLLPGEIGTFAGTYAPPTATLPVILTWDNGTVGSTAAYSWTLPGTYTIVVTATNPCGEASAAFIVTVCQSVEDVMIEGPASLVAEETGTYTASYSPPTATLPLTLTWDNGTVGSTAAYSWTLPGTYTITVTATNPCGEASAAFAVTVCQPVESVAISGPDTLLPGETGTFAGTYAPPTATLPLTLTWDNGTVGSTAAYSWTLPGTYTITVTATNPCGEASAAFIVTVCQPVESVAISGPDTLLPGETGTFAGTYAPPTATLPVTLTWDNGTVGSTAAYSWTLPGAYTVTVTATHACGVQTTSHAVQVTASPTFRIYLPVVFREAG